MDAEAKIFNDILELCKFHKHMMFVNYLLRHLIVFEPVSEVRGNSSRSKDTKWTDYLGDKIIPGASRVYQ